MTLKIKICPKSDLLTQESVKFEIPAQSYNREGFLVKVGESFLAYYNECPHIGLALDWDDNDFFSSDKTKLICKNHGAEFVPNSGSCDTGPCIGTKLKSIKVIEENETLFAVVEE